MFENSASIDVFAYAPRVRAPALVVQASRGHFPEALFDLLVEALPRGRKLVADAGHLMPMDAPATTAELLLSFGAEPA